EEARFRERTRGRARWRRGSRGLGACVAALRRAKPPSSSSQTPPPRAPRKRIGGGGYASLGAAPAASSESRPIEREAPIAIEEGADERAAAGLLEALRWCARSPQGPDVADSGREWPPRDAVARAAPGPMSRRNRERA